MRRAAALLGCALLAGCNCNPVTPPPLQACQPIPGLGDAGLPADTVYGFADLHAHPAIERAFSGRLVWGAALDDVPPSPLELPRIDGCPVETHTQPGMTAIDRAIGGQLFPQLSGISGFAHAPVNSLGLRETPAWPNARDLIHQQMNLGSLRRAYEGGLRLLFASTTDDQVIAALLTGPHFVNAFQPKPSSDYDSARRQLDLILDIVGEGSEWMEVARTPADARRIINSGKLAIVLSLEMNGLLPGEPQRLANDYGVRHFFPVHLIDNENGGTAALGALFNSSGAAVSSLYRPDQQPMQYMDLIPTRDYPSVMGRPSRFATLGEAPVYADLKDVPYATYATLCYEPLPFCESGSPVAATYTGFGQMNLRGLCRTKEECLDGGRPGADTIRAMMDGGWLIDVSHMGARSVEETTALWPGYPLIASHTDVVHLCRGSPTLPPCSDSMRAPESERNIDAEQARKVVSEGGVIGFGTGNGNYDTRAVLVARGSPLLTLVPSSAHACVANAAGCESVPSFEGADAGLPIERLTVTTSGGVLPSSVSAQPYVRVELRDPVDAGEYQRRIVMKPLACSGQACSATVDLGTREDVLSPPPLACTAVSCSGASCGTVPYTFDELESVTLEWMYFSGERQCASTTDVKGAPLWPIDAVTLGAENASGAQTLMTLGPRSGSPLATLGTGSGELVVYSREDRPSAAADVRASGRLLKVTLTAGASGAVLLGSSPQAVGADVCIAVRTRSGAACDGLAPPAAGDMECPSGWTSLNQRGAWHPGVTLYTFVRSAVPESDVCGLDVAVIDWPKDSAPLTIDSVRIDAAEDPMAHWVRRYAELARHVGGGQLGVLALGTDFNGLNGLMDISEYPVPASAMLPATCSPVAAGPQGVAPLRFREDDGSLGGEVRIDERGLATYGLLQDFVALASAYPGCGADVRDSLMLSAERTIRAWEKIVDPTAPPRPPLPVRDFVCDGGL